MPNQTHSISKHSRRTFLQRSAAAGGALVLPFGLADRAFGSTTTADFGPPSGGDDTAQLQAVLNGAPAGALVLARAGATYKVSDTLSVKTAGLTIDLQGATLAQVTPRGNMASSDSVFDLYANAITVRNGTLMSVAPFQNSSLTAAKVRVILAGHCVIESLTVNHLGRASSAVLAYGAPNTTISNVVVSGASIGAMGSNSLAITGCTVGPTAAGQNGITVVGYGSASSNDAAITNNRVFGHGRWGMEVTLDSSSGASPLNLARPTITGNQIDAPQPGAINGAISCLGYSGQLNDNVITDPLGYGIELADLANNVLRNQITRSSRPALNDPGYGIVVDGSDSTHTVGDAVLANNTITLANYAIHTANKAGSPAVRSNTIVDPLLAGINLTNAAPGASANGNTLHFTQPGATGSTRYGVVYAAGATITSNRLTYDASSVSRLSPDVPLYGPQYATVSGNTVQSPN